MKENKLIADFMGVQYKSDEDYVKTLEEMRLHNIGYEQGYMESQLKYHESWDWLMPVVEECRLESRCKYDTDDAWDKIHWALEEVNKEEIYKAVVEFIKQYNKEQ